MLAALQNVQDIFRLGNTPCESPSLRLNRFVDLPGKSDPDSAKKQEIDSIVGCINSHQEPQKLTIPSEAKSFVAKLGARLIINQAGGVLEHAGLCLHPHFGFPMIPGSAVKGIARHAAWCEWNEMTAGKDKDELAQKIGRIFGFPTNDDAKATPDGEQRESLDAAIFRLQKEDDPNLRIPVPNSGSVCFFEARPAGNATVETDIVNAHHKEYYSRATQKDEHGQDVKDRMGNPIFLHPLALDDENPVMNFFPAVKAGTKFEFSILALSRAEEKDLEKAEQWLRDGLATFGIGAKTAAGYGWFDAEDRSGTQPDPEIIAEILAMTGRQRTALFGQESSRFDDQVFRRSFLEFLIQNPRKFFTRNPQYLQQINDWSQEFGVELP